MLTKIVLSAMGIAVAAGNRDTLHIHKQMRKWLDKHEEMVVDVGHAIIYTESRGDRRAVNQMEGAVGIFQIRNIYMDDVNCICGYIRYGIGDRLMLPKSWEMYLLYTSYYLRHEPHPTPEMVARLHNAGPGWASKKAATDGYWSRVKSYLETADAPTSGAE